MTTGANNPSLDIVNGVGVQSAISTLATQLLTYRSQRTAVAAVCVLRDLIEDVLRGFMFAQRVVLCEGKDMTFTL